MIYVIYDESGALTGAFDQDLHPDHAGSHIEVTRAQARNWVQYVANAARDGLEDAPPPVEPAAMVPQQVTRRQALQALLLAGALDNVQPLIDAIADPLQRRLAQIEYDESQVFERTRPLVVSIGGALGLDLDALFTTAATL